MKRSRLLPGKPPQRKTRLKSKTGFKPRKNYMPSVSKNRGRKKAVAKLLYCDSFGVPFAEANRVAAQLQFKMRDDKRPEVLAFVHEHSGDQEAYFDVDSDRSQRVTFGKCWICGQPRQLEAHHFVSRYDFVGNICMCCHACHELVQHSQEMAPVVLKAMWRNIKFALSWIHLIKARGSYFPFVSLD